MVITAAILTFAGAMTAPRSIDVSGVRRIWPLLHVLASDHEPAESQWAALLDTPAFRRLDRNESLKRDYRLAWMPSRRADLERALAADDYHADVLRHLRSVATDQLRIQSFIANLDARRKIALARTLCSRYLPPGAIGSKPLPRIAFVINEPDAHVDGDMIIVDARFAMVLGSERFTRALAHELHHYYMPELSTTPEKGSRNYFLFHALVQLQKEGIADMIDKRSIPVHLPGRFVETQYNEGYAGTPDTLRNADTFISGIGDDAANMATNGEALWHLLVLAGHPTGFYMARTIARQLGRSRLIATEADPVLFVKAYNEAASRCHGARYVFSQRAIQVLDDFRRAVIGSSGNRSGNRER